MEVTTEIIKELRDKTGVSVVQCRKALEEAGGNLEKAEALLRKHAGASAGKKADRELTAGTIGSYIHDGSIGAMTLLLSETDFVAKNPEFGGLARELAMHVAAMNPADSGELLAQPFVKDESKTIQDLLNGATQKFGERVEVAQFVRFSARG